ncbi:AAA family ATPase [Diaminobutyricibacter tongyongensis]|uniref:AAA family ATPase n=1 Tax=Leifsonia tongyongensis TaxID=1268043 RepID=A0A6L9Y2L6_9MICO|nr:TniB family NTP-binding protein [Diaminobutyricibacter tongyongensis]NEN07755.1 AAA family ATPase [Diaminobutyricibacter tongyongensis]
MSALFRTEEKLRRTTVEGLTRILATEYTRPKVLTPRAYAALSDSKRLAYNAERARYTSGGIRLRTDTGDATLKLLRNMLRANVDAPNCTGLVIDADGHMGKTTLATHLMQWTMENYLTEFPGAISLGHVPVVYVEADPRSSGRALMKAFVKFFGGTVHRRETTDELLERTINLMTRANTHLVVLDEFQNIAAKNAGNGESVDYLKRLHNEVGATFVIAGIDVLRSEVIADTPRGRQLRSRFTEQTLTPYSKANDIEAQRWKQLLLGFEAELPLLAQERNSILQFSTLLMQRTHGNLGALAKLLTRTTVDLIWADDAKNERLTAELLMKQRLDISSERGEVAAAETKRRTRSGKSKATEANKNAA